MRGAVLLGRFDNVEELTRAGESWNAQLIPVSAASPGGVAANFFLMSDADIQYAYFEFAPALSMSGAPPPDCVTFNFMEPTHQRYWVRGHDLGMNAVWVFPAGCEFRSLSSPGFRVHTLSFPENRIHEMAESLELWMPRPGKRAEFFTLPPGRMASIRALCRAVRRGPTPSLSAAANRILRALLPYWFVRSGLQPRADVGQSRRQIAVARCLDLLQSADSLAMSNQEIASSCGVSERTLQYGFMDRFDRPLAAFLKLRRLSEVRHALLRAPPADVRIGDLASEHGFWHHGQFTKDYVREFGERPSQTLARVSMH